jgi:hypothetical protein
MRKNIYQEELTKMFEYLIKNNINTDLLNLLPYHLGLCLKHYARHARGEKDFDTEEQTAW